MEDETSSQTNCPMMEGLPPGEDSIHHDKLVFIQLQQFEAAEDNKQCYHSVFVINPRLTSKA